MNKIICGVIIVLVIVLVAIVLYPSKEKFTEANSPTKSAPIGSVRRFKTSEDGKIVILTEKERNEMIDSDDKNLIIHTHIEFRLVNLSPKDLKIYYEAIPSKKVSQAVNRTFFSGGDFQRNDKTKEVLPGFPVPPLIYIDTIPKNDQIYIYPPTEFLPGTLLFSKFEEDGEGEFAFKPYPLYYLDYNVYFGEISVDYLRTGSTRSDRTEILSLQIINRGLKPYTVWYRGDYIGRVEGYRPDKFEIDYSILTRNDEKHFQLGTWLDFIIDAPNATKQSIQLLNKAITTIYVGDVVGRTETNA